MKKLALKLDELRVQTFETGTAPPPRGTVRARQSMSGTPGCVDPCASAAAGCGATLVYTCTCKSEDACMMGTDFATCAGTCPPVCEEV